MDPTSDEEQILQTLSMPTTKQTRVQNVSIVLVIAIKSIINKDSSKAYQDLIPAQGGGPSSLLLSSARIKYFVVMQSD